MDSSSLLSPAHCVSNNLHQTARAVSRVYAEEMRGTGLARSQFAILGNLNYRGPLALTELAERMYMDRTTLTRNLKALERAGFVVRRESEADARLKIVEITREGKQKLIEARPYWRKAQARLLELFGEDRWRELESTLQELRELVN